MTIKLILEDSYLSGQINNDEVGVACMWELKDAYRVLVGKPDGKSCLEDLGVEGRVILN
jgi:hypothetical protein